MADPAVPTQPPSPSPDDGPPAVAFLLSALGRRVRERVESALKEHGLSLRHLSVLGHLSRDPGLSYSELARRAGVTAQSMQATLRRLEDDGAVERRTPAGRGRTAELHLTPRGRDLLARGQAAIARVDDDLLADFGGRDRAQLASALMRLTRRVLDPPAGSSDSGPPP